MKRKSTASTRVRPTAKSAPIKSNLGNDKSETVLLAVTGMSPAVLTETVWALSKESPPLIPHRVVVITTSAGRQSIEKELFLPIAEYNRRSVWDALRDALEKLGHDLTGKLRFGATREDIRVFAAADAATGRSRELEDIRTPEDNRAAADFVLDQVRGFAFNDDTRLVASLAGGRKTMGALLYAAMSLLGRSQDRLTHVLVNEPFESRLDPCFYFPAQPARVLRDGRGRSYTAAACQPHLADVPFVRLRRLFPEQFGKWPGHFRDLVRLYGERVDELTGPPEVSLDETHALAVINGIELKLVGREFPFFCFLFDRAQRNEPPLPNHASAEEPFQAFLVEWAKRHPEFDFSKGGGTDWRKNFDVEDLKKPLSSLRQKLAPVGLGRFKSYLFPLRGPLGLKISPAG